MRHDGPHPQYAFRAFHEILLRLKEAETRFLLLDLDGTLVRIRKRPEDVRLSKKAKTLLGRLASLPNTTVAILSGRNVQSLRSLVNINAVRYFGLHGAERNGKPPRVGSEQRKALRQAKRSARRNLTEFPGINLEDKGYGFTVHYRQAGPATIERADQALQAILAPLRHDLHMLHGKKVWEILPRQIPGKGETMKRVVADSPAAALAYIGDDEPDEPAFAALDGHVTIRVGQNPETHARFYLRTPSEVLRFLSMIERELRS
ncbi:MAG: trehalose-phosphatase [Candidatus Acidiferrales bacterium]